jgi:hypothetical protein
MHSSHVLLDNPGHQYHWQLMDTELTLSDLSVTDFKFSASQMVSGMDAMLDFLASFRTHDNSRCDLEIRELPEGYNGA